MAISFMGLENARVLSTPQMIGHMEITCRNLAVGYLDPGYDTVGTHVDVYHLAAAPMGTTVTFRAEVLAVEDRKVKFRVECFDEKEKLGEGTHERTIINVARFTAKMAAKAETSRTA
ncbi:MAG TPA: thioesterase family protein [Bryobacteraceae bacterium]|nr:thioesterase family protein [Bryobacteraceae bacterium]